MKAIGILILQISVEEGATMRFVNVLFISVLLSGAFGYTPIAMGVEANPQCIDDAKKEFEFCKEGCKENFLVDKDLCRNINHDCADNCRAGHSTCVYPYLEKLDNCKDACDVALEAQKSSCREQYGEGTSERHNCIDSAQIAGFVCRDRCREGVSAEIKQCSKVLGTCVKKCPPAK